MAGMRVLSAGGRMSEVLVARFLEIRKEIGSVNQWSLSDWRELCELHTQYLAPCHRLVPVTEGSADARRLQPTELTKR